MIKIIATLSKKVAMLITLQNAVNEIKNSIENAILQSGTDGKNNLIRTQKPIKLLHDVVKSELIRNKVKEDLIRPLLSESRGELSLSGFFKRKDQDICVIPKSKSANRETLSFEGILNGAHDVYGHEFTERCLSVNVRSQLSSSAKNFDTLYERTFAEALNLHLRCPRMVLGEFYMIAVNEYDSNACNRKEIRYRSISSIEKHIEKYLKSFSAVNLRKDVNNEHYKYERVCLLIVDFSKPIPKIYNSDEELIADGLLPLNSAASINNLSFPNFIESLIKIYVDRFDSDILK